VNTYINIALVLLSILYEYDMHNDDEVTLWSNYQLIVQIRLIITAERLL